VSKIDVERKKTNNLEISDEEGRMPEDNPNIKLHRMLEQAPHC